MKKALITGASGAIGSAIARALFEKFDLHICARREEKLQKLSGELGCKYYVLDFLKDEFDFLNNFDVIVNNAGVYEYTPIEKEADFSLLTLNSIVPYRLCALNAPYMKKNKWGRIVNIGSISAVVGEAGASLYAMSKSALFGMTKSLALELAQDNVTVNTVNPGWVKTDLADLSIEQSGFEEGEIVDTIPQRRFIEPCEIANLVKYLVSEEAKGLTGQCISICAGLSCG